MMMSDSNPAVIASQRLQPSGGTPERVAAVGEDAYYPTISRQRRLLAYSKAIFNSNLWRIAVARQDPPQKLIYSTRYELSPQYSPDGTRIAFVSTRSGAAEIWVCDSEGQNLLQLTSFGGPPARAPRWSPDGASIAFDARAAGSADIYVIGAEGGAPRRLTTDASEEEAPSWSRDGRWIYFGSNCNGSWQIWREPTGGGAAAQITRQGGFAGFESPDGRFFYYAKSRTGPGLWRVPVAGGEERQILDAPAGGDWNYFAVAGRGIYFLDRKMTGKGAAASIGFTIRLTARSAVSPT
jgi:Tol biopolymer transport system component